MSTLQRPSLASLADPAVLPDPYPVLAALREASPFTDLDGALVVACWARRLLGCAPPPECEQ